MNLHFPHSIGLAAGFDKNADYIDALATLGFGFIEIGTVTPKAQPGNPKPRLFRLIAENAIINRMGFNNKGADYVAAKLEKTRYRGILGINIGMNRDTPVENAVNDYLICVRKLKKFASYFTINISSPNTPGLRSLQQPELLAPLLRTLKIEAGAIPVVVKISPDVSSLELREMAQIFLQEKIDGVIATNTTLSRVGVENSAYASETGGLSGEPLGKRSTSVIAELHALLQDRIPIIASGGVMDAVSAQEKLDAGASLLQVYTGFVYQGPGIINALIGLRCNGRSGMDPADKPRDVEE